MSEPTITGIEIGPEYILLFGILEASGDYAVSAGMIEVLPKPKDGAETRKEP